MKTEATAARQLELEGMGKPGGPVQVSVIKQTASGSKGPRVEFNQFKTQGTAPSAFKTLEPRRKPSEIPITPQ